jgi:hypothetical protein
MLLSRILKVLSSNLGRGTGYSEALHGFPPPLHKMLGWRFESDTTTSLQLTTHQSSYRPSSVEQEPKKETINISSRTFLLSLTYIELVNKAKVKLSL